MLGNIEQKFGPLLKKAEWVSLGGGIHFTGEDYPLDTFAERLKALCRRVWRSGLSRTGRGLDHQIERHWKVTVLDTLFNGKNLAIVDSSIEAHMLDLLIYAKRPRSNPTTAIIVT